MRAVVVVVLCLWGLTAEALTRSAHLLEEAPARTERVGFRLLDGSRLHVYGLAQVAPDAALPPPPLVPAPGGELEQPAPKLRAPSVISQYGTDEYANSISIKEIGLGALMVLGADVLSVGVGLGATLVTLLITGPNDGWAALGAIVVGMFSAALVNFVAVPFAAALGAYWATNDAGKDNLGKGVGAAWLAHIVGTAVIVGLSFGASALQASAGGTGGGAGTLGVWGLAMLVHFVGIPAAASYGLHFGNVKPGSDLAPTRRPEKFSTRPSDPMELPREGTTVLALTF